MRIKYSNQRQDTERAGLNKQFISDNRLISENFHIDDVFNGNFAVQDMSDPIKYLPQYQQTNNLQTSCVQDCNVCCGNICIRFSYCWALCCCKCSSCVYELKTSEAGLVEEFGRFSRLLKPGINMINPCTEQVISVSLKIKILNVGSGQYMTKDNVKVTVTTSIAYRVTNPIISEYVLGVNLNRALKQLTSSSFRTVIGEQILDQVLTNRVKIVGEARQLVKKSIPPGILVDRIFMEDIVIPQETVNDLSSAAKQRRISEANIINSQADVKTAKLLKESAQLLDSKAAMQIRYLEIVQDLGKKSTPFVNILDNCKVIMPIGVNKKGFKN